MGYVATALLVLSPGQQALQEQIGAFARSQSIALEVMSQQQFVDDPMRAAALAAHAVAVVGEHDVGTVIDAAQRGGVSLGLIAAGHTAALLRWFELPSSIEEQIDIAFSDQTAEYDVMRCNGEVITGMFMLGESPFLDQRSKVYLRRHESRWTWWRYWLSLLWASLRNLFAIHSIPLSIVNGKDARIATTATSLFVLENDIHSPAARLLDSRATGRDGRVSLLLISPASVVQYVAFLARLMRFQEGRSKRLPRPVSLIRSDRVRIESAQELVYFIDGKKRAAKSIAIEVAPRALRVTLSARYLELHPLGDDDKDSMRIEHLPQHDQRVAVLSRHLPFFTHAVEEDFRELFQQLRTSAENSAEFLSLMVLSAVVATFGLFQNSGAVIIGAMVLAPLMAPIVSLSMGMLRSEGNLIKTSARTIAIGVSLALLVSSLLAFMVPLEKLTTEIANRIQPTLFDLGVAIACGVAGAYAYARESVMKSLPGVAISVALVPPLCVTGIGIGWLDWHILWGAFLLFLTNLTGIVLASGATFLVLGYAPFQRARRGMAISALLVAMVAIPLSVSFSRILTHWQIERATQSNAYDVNGKTLKLANIQVALARDKVHIAADVSSTSVVERADLLALKHQLRQRWQRDIELDVSVRTSL